MDGDTASPTLDLRPKKFCVRCSEFHALEDFGSGCERYYGSAPIRQCKVCTGWHALDRWNHNCMPPVDPNRSELPSPMVIRDGLPDIMNPLTGNPIDSKRALRAQYRAAGVEEVGNEKQKRRVHEPSEADIQNEVRKTIETLSSDNVSNDEMNNMLRSPAPTAMGLSVQ